MRVSLRNVTHLSLPDV